MHRTAISRRVREIAVFAMLGTLMFVSKLVMEMLPNVHLIGALTVLYTIVFRQKALIPIYIYVLLNGLYAGFSMWWIPYTYIWALLWGAAMLLPRRMPDRVAAVVYPALCAAHGFLFGILYAPLQALMYGLDFKGMMAWIAAGLPFDLIHGISNLAVGMLILPLSKVLYRLAGNEYSPKKKEKEEKMETNIYKIAKIDGEYATLIDEASGDELFIAMALLPLGVDIGTRLSYDFPDFTVI